MGKSQNVCDGESDRTLFGDKNFVDALKSRSNSCQFLKIPKIVPKIAEQRLQTTKSNCTQTTTRINRGH